jgi:hypothetical protein
VNRSRAAAAVLVAAILITALAVRIAYVEQTSYRAANDAGTYNRLGAMIARTGDYDVGNRPGSGAGGSRGPTAYFPPGFPYLLATIDLIDGHQKGGKPAVGPERIAMAVVGTVAVAMIGLVALEAFGPGVALICMGMAAVYPVMVELSGTLVAENLLIVLELAAVWTALRARRARHPFAWIGATGALTGLATLTHQNAILMLIPLGFAAVAAVRATGWRRASPDADRAGGPPGVVMSSMGRHGVGWGRTSYAHLAAARKPWRARFTPRHLGSGAAVALLLLTTVLTIAPWTVRNAIELHHFVPVSDETGITLVGTYNPDSAAFAQVPYKWRFFWKIGEDAAVRRHVGRYTEVQLSNKLQDQALDYIANHPLSPLSVAFHNTLRMFELEGTDAWHASAHAIGLNVGDAGVGVVAFWLVCFLALIGVFTRTARDAPRWIWAVPLLFALSIVFVNVETPRFREPIDPFLLMLAACAVEAAFQRLRLGRAPIRRRRRATRMASDAELVKMIERLT